MTGPQRRPPRPRTDTGPGPRPRALDLFAGEGLGAYGLWLAGYDVTAVDDEVKPGRAPEVTWVTADATTYPLDGYDLVTGSPPCTDRTTQRNVAELARGGDTGTAWMLEHTIDRFREHGARTGVPWVVENVQGAAADMPGAFKLCGSMFDITDEGLLLRRHRLFVSDRLVMAPGPCRCHGRRIVSIYGDLTGNDRPDGKTGRRSNIRAGMPRARRLMGAPWATGRGLSLGLPVDYTRFIGEQLLDQLAA